MKDIFKPKSSDKIRPFDMTVHTRRTTKFGNNSLAALRSKIWNRLPTGEHSQK